MQRKAGRASPGRKRAKASRATATATAGPAKAPLTVSREELLVDRGDAQFRLLVQRLLTFLSIHVAIRDGYASLLDVTGQQYTILLCIRNLCARGSVNIRTVADHLRLSSSYVTVETKTLEQGGLVFKERGTDDRRTVSLSLTPKAVALIDSIAALRRQVNDVQFGCLSRAEFLQLVPLVERLVQSGERALALQSYLRAHGMDEGSSEDAPAARVGEPA
ncbi:MAG: MarR family transcriptional regulator [Burkholderiales bacterium]|nr:MarR family transcriptional regulator [Burkholderiales bacterium]